MSELTIAEDRRKTLPEAIEKVLMTGDLSPLKPEERIVYYHHVCNGVGLNPYSNPLAYITLNGKLTLYAKKEATDQIRHNHKISIQIVSRERIPGDLYIVTARATDPAGRFDESTGVVNLAKLQGEQLANSLMKAETKAKRRVTLSFSGLSLLDESEIESIKGAVKVNYDYVPVPIAAIEANTGLPKEEKKSIFNRHDAAHVKWLLEALNKRNISADMQEIIMEELDGKDVKADLESVIKKILEPHLDSSS